MDKRIAKALAAVAKRYPSMPEIQREIVAAVMYCHGAESGATGEAVIEAAGHLPKLGRKILSDLVTAGVLCVTLAGDVYTLASKSKPRAPKMEIVESAPVNILDPAFLRVDAPPVDGAPPAIIGTFPSDADKGPETGPVTQAMLATAAPPVDAGPDDETALVNARTALAELNACVDRCKVEIRDIRARMRAAGKVVPEGDKRDKAPAASRSERPETGRVLRATHKGISHEVTVGEVDFAYGGESFKSLSAIGRKITGWQTCDGGLFFGLRVKSNASATPRAPRAVNAGPAAPVKPAPMGFGAAIAASKVASTPPATVPAPESTPDPVLPVQTPPASTPDADPFLAELETLGNVATPAPAVKSTKKPGRTFNAPRNA